MRERAAVLLAALTLLAAAALAAAESSVIFGPHPDLVAGAEALRVGRFEQGIEHTLAGLESAMTPQQRVAALNNLCAGHAGLRQYDTAVVYCSAALDIDPRSWQAYNNRALAYLGKGLLRLARRDLRRGLQLNPDAEHLRQVEALVDEALARPQPGHDRDTIA